MKILFDKATVLGLGEKYIVVENENSLKYMSEAFKEEQIKRINDFLK